MASLPKRQVALNIKIGKSSVVIWADTLKDALKGLHMDPGEKFSYRNYEGSNSIECVFIAGGKWKERGR